MEAVAFHMLGCKVNQYDSEAMLSEFINAGYEHIAFDEKADICNKYLHSNSYR